VKELLQRCSHWVSAHCTSTAFNRRDRRGSAERAEKINVILSDFALKSFLLDSRGRLSHMTRSALKRRERRKKNAKVAEKNRDR